MLASGLKILIQLDEFSIKSKRDSISDESEISSSKLSLRYQEHSSTLFEIPFQASYQEHSIETPSSGLLYVWRGCSI